MSVFIFREKTLKSCEASLYSGSSSTSVKSRLSPQPLTDLIFQCDGMLKKPERSMMDILKEVEQKKKVIYSF